MKTIKKTLILNFIKIKIKKNKKSYHKIVLKIK